MSIPTDPVTLATKLASLSMGSGIFHSGNIKLLDSDSEIGETGRSMPVEVRDPHGALLRFIQHLLQSEHADSDPHLLAIGYELEALLSIYSPESVKLCLTSRPTSWDPTSVPPLTSYLNPGGVIESSTNSPEISGMDYTITPGDRIRYEINLPVWEEGEVLDGFEKGMPKDIPRMRVLVSLPPTYPNSSPPQLQLLGRYLGSFSIDAGLFGDITRTYITSSGVPFVPGDVCVFEGLTHVQTLVKKWYTARLTFGVEGEKIRERDRKLGKEGRAMENTDIEGSDIDESQANAAVGLEEGEGTRPNPRTTFSYSNNTPSGSSDGDDREHSITFGDGKSKSGAKSGGSQLSLGLEIISSDPIVDRKSTFIGHAIRVSDEREVPLVIHELLSDRKISKAAHPAIFAYRIAKEVGGAAGKIYNTDYDDDGETQAGARLKHLLEILELENVLVVVSRWYGGILLGPDRFKHINQAARDALELAGFLGDGGGGGPTKGRKGGKR